MLGVAEIEARLHSRQDEVWALGGVGEQSSAVERRSSANPIGTRGGNTKRELTGESDVDPKTAVLEAAPESQRWDPVPGSTGHKVSAAPSADEDAEGRSDQTRLVEEGLGEAEHDHMFKATRAGGQKNY